MHIPNSRHVVVAVVLALLSTPVWAQPPNRLAVVQRVAEADPARFACAHVPDRPCQWDYIIALVCDLRREDERWGLNGRRGSYEPSRLSWDAINWLGEGPGRDPRTGRPVTVIDVIVGAGAPGQRPTWGVIDQAGDGAWIVPESCPGGTPPSPPQPTPPPEPGPDHQQIMTRIGALEGEIKVLRATLSEFAPMVLATAANAERAADAATRAAHDAKVGAEAILVIKDWLAQGLALRLNARFIGTVTGEVTVKGGQ